MVPGLTGSGPDHWQTHWLKTVRNASTVEQDDWEKPDRASWIDRIDDCVDEAGPDVVLVGHSLGAIAIVAWAAREHRAIRGALLVAPCDLDVADLQPELRGWAPIPMTPLPFPSIVVASSDDTWVTLARAEAFADAWCADFVDIGAHGHIDSASKLGTWAAGREQLAKLL